MWTFVRNAEVDKHGNARLTDEWVKVQVPSEADILKNGRRFKGDPADFHAAVNESPDTPSIEPAP